MKTSSAPAVRASGEHETDAVPQYEAGADRNHHVDHRRQPRLEAAGAQADRDVVEAFAIETLLFIGFARKRLDDARGRNRFLYHRCERALLLLDLAGRRLDTARIAVHHHEQRRRHRQPDQAEPPVEIEHHRHHADDGDEIEANLQDRGDEVFRRVDVAGQPHHHVAGLLLLIEGQRHPLDVVIQAMPQVESDALADRAGKILVGVGTHRVDDGDEHHRHGGRVEHGQTITADRHPSFQP